MSIIPLESCENLPARISQPSGLRKKGKGFGTVKVKL